MNHAYRAVKLAIKWILGAILLLLHALFPQMFREELAEVLDSVSREQLRFSAVCDVPLKPSAGKKEQSCDVGDV